MTPWGMQYKGAVRLDELHRELKTNCMIRRRKKDVLKDLPPKQRFVVPIALRNRKEYEEAQTDLIRWLRKYNPAKANKAKKAERLVKWGYLKRLICDLKIAQTKEWIDSFLAENDGKLIVVGENVEPLKRLHEMYPKNSLLVNGSVKGKKRMVAVDQLNNDRRYRIMFGNIDAIGVGLNLVGASAMAVIQLPWTPGKLGQVEARIDRIGQKFKTFVYYLIAKDTIEEKHCHIIQNKQSIADAAIDGESQGTDLDLFDQLEKELKRYAKIKKGKSARKRAA